MDMSEQWEEYTSNSYSRIGTVGGYQEVIYAFAHRDGFASVQFRSPADKALVIAAPEMAELLDEAAALLDLTACPSNELCSRMIRKLLTRIGATP
jgi:hypothetical protein